MGRRGLIRRNTVMINIPVFQLILLWFNIATTIYHRNKHKHKHRWNNYFGKISLELSLIGALHLSTPLYTQIYMNFSAALILVAFPLGCHPIILLLNLAKEKETPEVWEALLCSFAIKWASWSKFLETWAALQILTGLCLFPSCQVALHFQVQHWCSLCKQ